MSYVEWLRVRNSLIGVAGTMIVIMVIALVLRIVFAPQLSSTDNFIHQVSVDRGSIVSQSTLPDGTPRTTIRNNKEDLTVTIDGGGSFERHVVIDRPRGNSTNDDDTFKLGPVSTRTVYQGDRRITTLDTNSPTPLGFYFLFSTIVALIVATVLGFPFAKENDGHLEIAAMRPNARLLLALRTVGVDLAGIILASLIVVVALIICQTMYELPRFSISDGTLPIIATSVLAPFAWYGMLAAATSSLKRGYGAVVGFAWPVAILVFAFGMIQWGDSVIGQLMHSIFGTLMWIDPLKYLSLHMTMDRATGAMIAQSDTWVNVGLECVLFVIYTALAVIQWQRVEA